MQPGYQIIQANELPTSEKWCLPPLYKENAMGNVSFWQVCFDGKKDLELYHGTVGGIIESARTEVDIKGGKTMQEQALIRARRRYMDKFTKDGYRPGGVTLPENPQAMGANIWVPAVKMERAKNVVARWKSGQPITEEERLGVEVSRGMQKGKEVWRVEGKWHTIDVDARTGRYVRPVAVQPKLDGGRLLCKLGTTGVECRTRLNNAGPPIPEIRNEVLQFLPYLPLGSHVDGEIYSPDLNFQDMMRVFKTAKTRHPLTDRVKYYIFDVVLPTNVPFEERFSVLLNAYMRYLEDGNTNDWFRIVGFTLAYSDQDVMDIHEQFKTRGYEGSIIRKLSRPNQTPTSIKESLYKGGGHSSNILKYKDFVDEEGTIVGVQEAKGTEEGAAMFVIEDERGNRFPVRLEGPIEERRYWFQNPQAVIGKKLTYKYQPPLSTYGVPRFPIGVAIRDYE